MICRTYAIAVVSITALVCRFSSATTETPASENGGSFKQIATTSADELEKQLEKTPVIGLGNAAPSVLAAYGARIQDNLTTLPASVAVVDALPLLLLRPDLRMLPLRRGDDSQLTPKAAAILESLSRQLRIYLNNVAPINDKGERPRLGQLREMLQADVRGKRPEWLRPEAIPTLQQLLTHEDKPVRLMLVDLLQAIPGKRSSAALVKRAVFDLDAEVRQAAVAALRERPLSDSRRLLVGFLRYPWPAAAEHAAETLVGLQDKGVTGQLVATLDLPDPSAPAADGNGKNMVKELVRVHHLTNCLLCHPPATDGLDPVLGADPVLVLPVPRASLRTAAGQLLSTPGSHSYGGSGPAGTTPALLRGDVTYLRQDFSVLQALPPELLTLRRATGPLAAPTQRFDFMLRKRPVSSQELARLRDSATNSGDYPQRQAVLFALRELSGRDAGPKYDDWLSMFPDAKEEAQAAKLANDLIDAKSARREQLLSRLREEKGIVYTLALANVIPAVEGKFQEQTRGALVERLSRMTSTTLRERLREEDSELRRAAATACGIKGDKAVVPDLIGLLDDKDADVITSTQTALRSLTGQSFSSSTEMRSWWSRQSSARETP